jgi:iron(III) transport system permease protein
MAIGETKRRLSLPSADTLLLAIAGLYVALFGLWPLVRLFAEAFVGDPAPIEGFAWSRSVASAVAHTIEASLGASVVSTLVGGAFALVVGLTDVRGRAGLVFLLLTPLLVPPQISALAWIQLLAPGGLLGIAPGTPHPLYGREGIMFVMGLEHAPLVFLTVAAALRGLPRELSEAARVAGARPPRIVRTIVVPLTAAAFTGGFALAFVSSIGNFGVPALLGIPGRYTMLTTLIYQRLAGFGPSVLGEVAVLALLLAGLAVVGLVLQAIALRRLATVERTGRAEPLFRLGRRRPLVEAALWATLLVLTVLPLLALVAASLVSAPGVPLTPASATLAAYGRILLEGSAARRAFANSAFLALATCAATAGVAAIIGYYAACRRSRFARGLDILADAPYALPGLVLALAIILVFLPKLPLLGVGLYGTIGLVLVGYLGRFLPLALRPAMAAFRAIEPSQEEAARIAGARSLRRLITIALPAAAPALGAGAVLVFMTALNELTVSAILWSPGNETLGVVVYSLQAEGNSTAAAAVAVLSLLATFALALLITLAGRRLPEGVLPWRA